VRKISIELAVRWQKSKKSLRAGFKNFFFPVPVKVVRNCPNVEKFFFSSLSIHRVKEQLLFLSVLTCLNNKKLPVLFYLDFRRAIVGNEWA